MWAKRFRRYMANPHTEWLAARSRQAEKLIKRGHSTRGIVTTAKKRARRRAQTLFVVNCGSSGSHWLTTMLADLGSFTDCGEVYLPQPLLTELDGWRVQDRAAFLDCVHLAHAPEIGPPAVGQMLINSAHKAGWRLSKLADRRTTVLLIRDPIDVVLSRTFRKPDHKAEVAPESGDVAFLDENIRFVRDFYARIDDHDVLVRYEDMKADASQVLEAVCVAAGVEVSPARVERTTAIHGAGSPSTNIYQGPKIEIPAELRERAASALDDIRQRHGYAD